MGAIWSQERFIEPEKRSKAAIVKKINLCNEAAYLSRAPLFGLLSK
jgi:hypothetical protein